MTDSYPLKWPTGWERTSSYSRKSASFKTTMGRARDELLRQLKMMKARDVVISSNVHTYIRGGQEIMYADQSAAKEDPGVSVYFTWRNEQYSLACDKYNLVQDNLQALMKTVDAIRGIERWGTGGMFKAAFAGFKAIPEKAQSIPWSEILGISRDASKEEIRSAYLKLIKQYHPDQPGGGDVERFNLVNQAYKMGMNE